MNASPPPCPPTVPRLRVSSAAEAAKIRDFAAAWVAFEPAAARMEKSKRWRTLHARFRAGMERTRGTPAERCLGAWVRWQMLRCLRASVDLVTSVHGPAGAVPDAVRYYTAASVELARSRVSAFRTFQAWKDEILAMAMTAEGEPESVLLAGAQPVADWVQQQIAFRARERHRRSDTAGLALRGFGGPARLDAGQRAALVLGVEHPDVFKLLTEQGESCGLLTPAAVEQQHAEFLRAFAALREMAAPPLALMKRRSRLIRAVIPPISVPPGDWRDAHFAQWLFDESVLRVCERLCQTGRGAFDFDTPFDVPLFLSSPLCWRLWLDDRFEAARLGSANVEPVRTVLRELVEAPARFLRFPNPTPAHAEARRALRLASDLLEGPPLPVERAALLDTLARGTAEADERLQGLAEYCAQRWRAGVSPKIHARLVGRFRRFLLDDIAPQAPDILRGCAVEVGPALRTAFDAEFEQLVAHEEAAQEQLEAELRRHAEAWREHVPTRSAPEPAGEPPGAAAETPENTAIVLRYLSNLGESRPREERIATTWAGLEDALEAFCAREGIRVTIPFSSIAHALEQYVVRTPPEQKHVWPEREAYGPLELHKIKRGGMRLLVRESEEGLWLHLLQRRDWFLGER